MISFLTADLRDLSIHPDAKCEELRYLQNYLEQEYRFKSVEQVRTAHIKMFLAMMDDKKRKPRLLHSLVEISCFCTGGMINYFCNLDV